MPVNGGLMRENDPAQPVVNTVEVENIDATIAKIEELEGTIVVPKMPIPGLGWLVYFTDPRGNITGAMQSDSSAGG
jgi:hypothetical protein